MNEKLLQFIWNHQLFNNWSLVTINNERVEVVYPGKWNMDQGPDFLSAHIRIGDRLWVGHVELHVQSSDWDLHGHGADSNYENVILHVVWKNDKRIMTELPTIELSPLIPSYLLKKYTEWMWRSSLVPCSQELPEIENDLIHPYLEWLTAERFQQRASGIYEKVKSVGMDWQEAFWRSIARNFGYKVNTDAFESIACTIPYKVMLKHRNEPAYLEALLLGQAGLLRGDTADPYAKKLFREYGFLRKKYQFPKSYVPVHFLRMRPGNFPTIRLAQLAMLVHEVPDLFRLIKDVREPADIRNYLKIGTSEYWDHHYRFNEPSAFQKKLLGEQMIGNLVLNTILPFIISYHRHIGNDAYPELMTAWLGNLPAEMNAIVREFVQSGIQARHAGDSQGLLELHKQYCSNLKCLDCAIGKFLMRRSHMISVIS